MSRSQRRKKIDAITKYGGKCVLCGYNKCPAALDFHHLFDKKFQPSYIILRWAWERVKEELDKCVLVCANCHREIHYFGSEILIDREPQSWYNKACEYCNEEFETKDLSQKLCSVKCSQAFKRKVVRPTKEELLGQIIDKKVNFSALGRRYGVSDNAIRKWFKYYNINLGP